MHDVLWFSKETPDLSCGGSERHASAFEKGQKEFKTILNGNLDRFQIVNAAWNLDGPNWEQVVPGEVRTGGQPSASLIRPMSRNPVILAQAKSLNLNHSLDSDMTG